MFGGDPMWIGVCSICEDYSAYDEDFVLMDDDYFRDYAESVTSEPVAPSRQGPPGGWGGLIASGAAGFIAGLLGRGRPRDH